ncbi:MAG: cytochrome c3 family protein [Betaproteobacteria bacterium]
MRRSISTAASAFVVVFAPLLFLFAQGKTDMPHGDMKRDCGECHTPERWVPVDTPPTFRHATTGFALELAHAKASCRACHRSLVFDQVGTACADCHQDAHRGELGFRCEACHTPTTWTNQREMSQVHSRTRFPLLAIHARLDCTACHRNQRPFQYANTPAECGACHYETYLQTTSPNHQQAGFSRRCEDCHSVTSSTWLGARFSHPASFPLAGGHAGLACARCHSGGTYAGLSSACVSCHRADYAATTNPNHVAGGFPTTCESCHSINAWRPARFDHNQTRFPLTGAHVQVDCARCHVGGRYSGTPTDCYSCHRADYAATSNPSHQAAGFPTQCEACHNTTAWRPATFDHDGQFFPINSGRHRGVWSSCSDCHVNPANYAVFECIFCHAHSNRAQVDSQHREVGGYAYQSAACYRCHPRGVGGDAPGRRPRRLP